MLSEVGHLLYMHGAQDLTGGTPKNKKLNVKNYVVWLVLIYMGNTSIFKTLSIIVKSE